MKEECLQFDEASHMFLPLFSKKNLLMPHASYIQ